jgi:hypothetical protein
VKMLKMVRQVLGKKIEEVKETTAAIRMLVTYQLLIQILPHIYLYYRKVT